jgi:UDP-2,3-diacylglucosamine hydrolase
LPDLTFISDLHLGPGPGAVGERFLALAGELAARVRAGRPQRLYVLGDLFSFWVERPALMRRLHGRALEALAGLVGAGCPVAVLDGNRDFGYGPAMTAATGAEVLGERAAIEAGGRRALLLHGDELLTADRRYQFFKRLVRSAPARLAARRLPGALVLWTVARLEALSRREKAAKPARAMEPDLLAAAEQLRAADAEVLVCGHVHAPGERALEVSGRACRLFILGGWSGAGGAILEWPAGGEPGLVSWPRGG